jgi:hypothetical protein
MAKNLGVTCSIQVSNRDELDVIVIDYCGFLVMVIANVPGSGYPYISCIRTTGRCLHPTTVCITGAVRKVPQTKRDHRSPSTPASICLSTRLLTRRYYPEGL